MGRHKLPPPRNLSACTARFRGVFLTRFRMPLSYQPRLIMIPDWDGISWCSDWRRPSFTVDGAELVSEAHVSGGLIGGLELKAQPLATAPQAALGPPWRS